MQLTWRIDWHEGTAHYEGATFEDEQAFLNTLRLIGNDARGGGYNKTHVTLLADGAEIWAERLDLTPSATETPRSTWEGFHAFYQSERGRRFAQQLGFDADARVAYYAALMAEKWAQAAAVREAAFARPEGRV